jgi:hypothetical protein
MNYLFRSCLLYFIASLLVVLCARYIHLTLVYMDTFYVYVNLLLAPIFNQVGFGRIIHQTLVLILIPLILIGIPALIYHFIKHKTMPYLLQLTWSAWLILVLCTIMIR